MICAPTGKPVGSKWYLAPTGKPVGSRESASATIKTHQKITLLPQKRPYLLRHGVW
jgi:hypothetical protein